MLRRLLWLVGFVVLLLGGAHLAVHLLARGGFFERGLVAELRRYVDGTFEVEEVDVRWWRRTVHVANLVMREQEGRSPALAVPRAAMLDIGLLSDGRLLPDVIRIEEPRLLLEERADGSFSPLHLLKPWVPSRVVPTVEIENGTIVIGGAGPVNRLLDGVLRPGLARRIEHVAISTFPMPATAPDLLGFHGTMELPGVSPVALRGGVGHDGRLRMDLEAPDLDLRDAGFLDALGGTLRQALDRHVHGGRLDLRLFLAAPGGSGEPELGARLTARHLDFDLPGLASRLEGGEVEAVFDGEHLVVHDGRVRSGQDELRIEGVVEDLIGEARWRFRLDGRDLGFDRSFAAAITEEALRQAIDDYAPTGTFDFSGELERGTGDVPRVRWSVRPRGGSGSFVGHVSERTGRQMGFPYRLLDLEGEISGDEGAVRIHRVRGTHRGGGRVTIDGFVDLARDGDVFEVRVRADGVPVDAELRDGLAHSNPGAGAVFDRFAPSGVARIDVTVGTERPGEPSIARGTVDVREGRAVFDAFPVPLEDVTGRCEFDGDVYVLRDVTAALGAGRVAVDGTVETRGDDVALDLRIRARDVAADAVLALAFEHALGEDAAWWPLLEPCGPFDLDLELTRQPGERPRFRALLWPKGLDVLPAWFPVPVQGVMGRVEFGDLPPGPDEGAHLPRDGAAAPRRFYVRLDRLAGRAAGAPVSAHGQIVLGGATSLDVRGLDFPLGPDVVAAARRAEALAGDRDGLHVTGLLEALEPDGRVAFDYRLRAGPGESGLLEGHDRLDLRLCGVNCASPALPGLRVQGLEGTLSVDFDEDRAVGRDLRAGLAGLDTSLHCAELDVDLGAERIVLSGDVDLGRLPFDERLEPLVPQRLRKAFLDRAPSGRLLARLDPFELTLPRDGPGGAPRLGTARFSAQGEFEDCAMARPLEMRELAGRFDLEAGGDLGPEGSLAVRGGFSGLRFRLGRLDLRDVEAAFALGEDRVSVSRAAGRLAGGRLPPERNSFDYAIAAETYEGQVALEDADLAMLLEQVFGAARGTRGRVSGDFRFRGRGVDLALLEGEGGVEVRDARLGDHPLLARVYRNSLGFVLGRDRAPQFHSARGDFRWTEGQAVLTDFELRGFALLVTGRGVIGRTGLDVLFVPRVVPSPLSVVAPVMDALTEIFLSWRIYGPLNNPRVVYWNAALDLLSSDEDVTRLPRLAPRPPPDWHERW